MALPGVGTPGGDPYFVDVYGKIPKTYLVSIQGIEWGFNEQPSEQAQKNLDIAFSRCKELLG